MIAMLITTAMLATWRDTLKWLNRTSLLNLTASTNKHSNWSKTLTLYVCMVIKTNGSSSQKIL